MKIAIDARPLMNSQYTGVSWFAYNLIDNILKQDSKNEYLLFYNSSKKHILPGFSASNYKYAGFSFPNKIFNLSQALNSWPCLDKIIGNIDCFIALNLNFISISNDVKFILCVHDLSYIYFKEFYPFKMRLWHKFIKPKKIINRADYIMAVSENTKTDIMREYKIQTSKIIVNYPGVDNNYKQLSSSSTENIKKKYNLPDRFCLFLGSLEPRKNIDSVIEAYNLSSKKVNLVIAGPIGWKSKKVLIKILNNSKIKYLSYVDEKDKPAIYNLAEFFVYPSFYEGFGLPLVEAMACGCPVICGNNSSQEEVVADAGIYVDPYDINQIASAMNAYVNDDKLKDIMKKRGIDRADQFKWSNTAKKILDMI